MLAASWQLTLIAILPIFLMVWMTFDFGNRITALFFKVDTVLGDLSSRLQENVSGVQVVRAFAAVSCERWNAQEFATISNFHLLSMVYSALA
jgi:ABC-type multidrug transport system fused ATPase/permease subunit